MTRQLRADFVKNLGILRIHVQNLDRGLRTNNVDVMESESQVVQDVLLNLIKSQRKLSREQQLSLKPYFTTVRKDALRCLELARKILDDSLQATLELVRILEEANNYGSNTTGSAVIIDRKA